MNPLGWFKRSDPAVAALRSAAAEAQRSRLPQMAAALSFRTVFGLIPVLVVALVIVKARSSENDQSEVVRRILEYTGLSSITVHPDPEIVGPPDLEQGSRELQKWITELIDKAEKSISLGAIGLVGAGTVLYAALAMIMEIERAFNQIFRVPRGRSITRQIVNYWTLLTLGTAGLMATFYVGAQFQGWAERELNLRSTSLSVQLIGYGITVAISTVLLTFVYMTVPNTRVKILPALAGAILSALLWEAGKWGFQQYIAYSSGYARIYGSLALIPLFLLWVYVTWLIILFGLSVTCQLQYGRWRLNAQPLSEFGPTVVEPSSPLVIMVAFARAMSAGTPQSIKQIAHSTGLSEAVVSMSITRLAERGLLHRVDKGTSAVADAEPVYTLARIPSAIRTGEILSIGFDLAGGPEANPVVARMRKAQIDAAADETLAQAAGIVPEPARIEGSRTRPALPGVSQPSEDSNGSAKPRPATLR